MVLRGVGKMRILASPARFALKVILGMDVSPAVATPEEIKYSIEGVIKAKSKAQLEVVGQLGVVGQFENRWASR